MNLEQVHLSVPILISFLVYAGFMLYIGFYFYAKNKTAEDYFLGARDMGPFVSALSAGASDMSGWLLMGLPGALYVSGLVDSYIAIGLSIGALINWSFVAKRLRIYTSVVANSITIPDYFETRFSDDKKILRLISAFVILIFFTIYISSGLVSGAKLFEEVFGVGYMKALILGTSIIVAYTFLGGYKAVCWTDLVQGVMMMLALIILPAVMIYEIGGFSESFELLRSLKPEHLSFVKESKLETATFIAIVSSLAWGLGYFGQPHILVRFMSIKRVKDIPLATFVGISWMVISLIGACFVGLIGVAYIAKFNVPLSDPEKIFIVASQLLFNPWIAGILLSAILAAIMSTASSQLLVSSSTIIEDFYTKIFNKKIPPAKTMLFSRISVLLVACIAFFISTDRDSKILDIVAYAWAGFGASFGSVILFSLFWGRMTRMGAIAGMLSGAVVVVVYKNFLNEFFPIYEIVPGFIIASIAIIVVSLMQPVRVGTKEAFEVMLKEVRNNK